VDVPFLPDVDNDVFISYRFADNVQDIYGGWVTEFARYLDGELNKRVGQQVKIYFDQLDVRPNSTYDEMYAQAEASAVFVAIASRAYACTEKSCARGELDAFVKARRAGSSLFVVEILPLNEGDTYPPPLDQKTPARFWRLTGRTPIELRPDVDREQYFEAMSVFAEHVSSQLRQLAAIAAGREPRRVRASRRADAGRPAVFPRASGTVLLAQTTDDLAGDREHVRTYLTQAGLEVVPKADYPQGGDAFRAAVADDLARADLFVQLLGPLAGRRPPDVPEGYTAAQLQAAKHHGTEILQWRQPGCDPDAVADEDQRRLLNAETVIVSGLETFKTEIVRRLQKPAARPPRGGTPLVYIDLEQVDLGIGHLIRDVLKDQHVGVALPMFEGSTEERREDMETNMRYSDALIVVYGRASQRWVRTHLLRLHRTGREPRANAAPVVLMHAPPPGKPDVEVYLPDVQVIRCDQSTDFGPLLAVLQLRTS
jgi:hypothetical protein